MSGWTYGATLLYLSKPPINHINKSSEGKVIFTSKESTRLRTNQSGELLRFMLFTLSSIMLDIKFNVAGQAWTT